MSKKNRTFATYYSNDIYRKMKVKELVNAMNLTVFCGQENLDREIKGGYTSDLLSDVMGFAREGQVWITLQTHKNVLAIASLKELAAILLVKGNKPEDDMLEQAVEEGIPVLGTDAQTFETTGKVYQLINQ
jgi:predicted transcriptional regulator